MLVSNPGAGAPMALADAFAEHLNAMRQDRCRPIGSPRAHALLDQIALHLYVDSRLQRHVRSATAGDPHAARQAGGYMALESGCKLLSEDVQQLTRVEGFGEEAQQSEIACVLFQVSFCTTCDQDGR